jgi:hypothetical protein
VTFKQVLLLFAFALLAMQRVRMMGWYANVYGWIVAPHLADIAQRYFGRAQTAPGPVGANGLPPGRSFH